MQIFKQALIPTVQQADAIIGLNYRPVPNWLGNFKFLSFAGATGPAYARRNKLPQEIDDLAVKLAVLAPEQTFNTCFVQRYLVGESVSSHRDPRNNIGHTLIAVFGCFKGAETTVNGDTFQLEHGDVLKLECTINGIQGPPHSVSPVTSGERYTLILNTII